MPETATTEFTPAQIAKYVGEVEAAKWTTDFMGVGNMLLCIKIIDSHEPGDPDWNRELVRQAFDSILSWASDYGCELAIEDGEVVIDIAGV